VEKQANYGEKTVRKERRGRSSKETEEESKQVSVNKEKRRNEEGLISSLFFKVS